MELKSIYEADSRKADVLSCTHILFGRGGITLLTGDQRKRTITLIRIIHFSQFETFVIIKHRSSRF